MQTSRARGYLVRSHYGRRAGRRPEAGRFLGSGGSSRRCPGVESEIARGGAGGAGQPLPGHGQDWRCSSRGGGGGGVGRRRSAVSGGKRFRRPRALDRARGRRADRASNSRHGRSHAGCAEHWATHTILGWARSRRAPSQTGVVKWTYLSPTDSRPFSGAANCSRLCRPASSQSCTSTTAEGR